MPVVYFAENNYNQNYSEIFNYISKLKVLCLTGNGRPGTGFFMSLVDGNKEIIHIPNFCCNWDYCKFKDDIDAEIICDRFIARNPYIFNSKFVPEERYDQLGAECNQSIVVESAVFKNHFIKLLSKTKLTEKNIFLCVHAAYYLTIGRSILDTRLILYNLHTPMDYSRSYIPIKNYEILHFTRDPRIGFVRYIESKKGKKPSWHLWGVDYSGDETYYDPGRLCTSYISVIEQVQIFKKIPNKISLVTLEDLHEFRLELLNKIFRQYGISELDKEPKSTFWGLQWHADKFSENRLTGFQDGMREFNYRKYLSYLDVLLIEYLTYKRSNNQGHNTILKLNKLTYYLLLPIIILLIFIPSNYEKKFFIYALKKQNTLFILKNLFWFSYRISFCFRWLSLNIRNKIFIPEQIKNIY